MIFIILSEKEKNYQLINKIFGYEVMSINC